MFPSTSPRKKPKSPGIDIVFNPRTSITCTNVPEALFETAAAKKHFCKFGRVHRIKLIQKRQTCIVEYEQPLSADRAILNAGAYDGFMFDVTRTKQRVRKKSKKEDDPDWVPDSDVEEELSAMSGAPSSQIITRNKVMETDLVTTKPRIQLRAAQALPVRKKVVVPPRSTVLQKRTPVKDKITTKSQTVSGIESPVVVTNTQTTLSTFEAASELHQLRFKISLTPDEQWRTLDARDKILRGWGGAGSRVKVGGATIGTCQDMCPEKELLQRQAEHQVASLETADGAEGQLEPRRAVKQYSRSSADQEMPMCYELRPARALARTCAYLLHEIADTPRQVSLADWFHFMWDRFRSIRKDITQQALCCAEAVRLVEACARFHAHCAARLADLEHAQFDQRLNTDNLTKCLQTLKHMYADVARAHKPREPEFRGYVALLNLGDANFWWEIKQLPLEIQKSEPIVFAIKVFNALDNNNYVRFFRLVRQEATYLQACILLRYFNDVRARALARIVKAYAPRGGSRFPAADLMSALAFESLDKMKAFITHYGLRFGRIEEHEPSIILSRHQFIEDSDPFPTARAVNLIESKRRSTVGEVIAGGPLPDPDYKTHVLHSSFTKDGKLKETALIAEEQGFNTTNDSNKDIKALKAEIQRLAQGGRNTNIDTAIESKFTKPDLRPPASKSTSFVALPIVPIDKKIFSFKPAIIVEPTDIIKNSPEKIFGTDTKSIFSFSKPQETEGANLFVEKLARKSQTGANTTSKSLANNIEHKKQINAKAPHEQKGLFHNNNSINKTLFKNKQESQGLFDNKESGSKNVFKTPPDPKSLFGGMSNENKDPFKKAPNVFKSMKPENSVFVKSETTQSIFSTNTDNKQTDSSKIIFGQTSTSNNDDATPQSIFAGAKEKLLKNLDSSTKFVFTKPSDEGSKHAANIFASYNKESESKYTFAKPDIDSQNNAQSVFAPNGGSIPGQISPRNLFKSALNAPNGSDAKSYLIFQSKNKTYNESNLGNDDESNDVYQFNEEYKEQEEKLRENIEIQQREEEERKKQELRRQKQLQQEEMRRKEEAQRKQQEEFKLLEERRMKEEMRKQEELKKKLEAERKAELQQIAEEKERMFKERVDRESTQLVEELVIEINNETNQQFIREEQEKFRTLMKIANDTCDVIVSELRDELCQSEMKAELFLTYKLMKKWFYIWRQKLHRNLNRRKLLDDTPVWLPERTPLEEAFYIRRKDEDSALKYMNDIHNGYKFSGELKQFPPPQHYKLMEIIKSPLLKRMKEISYPYDKCFFWKVTLVAPGKDKWFCRKINLQKWLLDVFSDNKKHEESETLINVARESWNNLMNFAISVSLLNMDKMVDCAEAIEGTNAVLFYFTEKDNNFAEIIEQTLKSKYPYQVVPVAVILPKTDNTYMCNTIQYLLVSYEEHKIISGFKIFILDPQNVNELLDVSTKKSLKWLAKKFPNIPPLEIDHLKSICQRYLGNEVWCRLRTERDGRMSEVLKDIQRLIRCYNAAVDRLTSVITNEDLFNYGSFPIEFNKYLDHILPYPKPYEFIPSSVRTSENVSTIRDIMRQLKLPLPSMNFNPKSVVNMQHQIRSYCNQIGWFENPEEVVCKVIAVIPQELSNINMSCEDFAQCFAHYDLIDFLNIIVYEKINKLKKIDNQFAIYEQSVLHEYRNMHWVYEVDALTQLKHKAIEYEDELDYYIAAKRRRLAMEPLEYLMLEDKDVTVVEDNINVANVSITKLNSCSEAVRQLEEEIEEEKKKSEEFENMLRAALADV